jgi:hypothetical protein
MYKYKPILTIVDVEQLERRIAVSSLATPSAPLTG